MTDWITVYDRRRIMSEARARGDRIERLALSIPSLEPDVAELAQRVFGATNARNGVRAWLIRMARDTGALEADGGMPRPAEVLHAIARDDRERDALIDALLAAARASEDDWIALGRALALHRMEHPEPALSPRP